jgi:uncharacterized protein YkwD
MASVLDGGDRYGRPSRPTSHRRKAPKRHRGLRRSAITAVVGGLAITAPLMLRSHGENEVALGPGSSTPGVPAPAATSGKVAPPPPADPTTAASSHTKTPVSRDATRSATAPLSSQASPAQTSPAGGGMPAAQISPDQAAAYEAQVVALTNDQRAAHGCPALRDDPRLRTAAVGHSVDMQASGYFAHNTPNGVTPWARIEAQGYSDPSAENIAMGQPTPQAVVDAWMNSPGHRANILSCSSKAIGVGVQFGPGGPWWTQDFGYS